MATCSSYTEIFCWIAVLSLAASASTQTARYQSTRESEPKEASVRNLPGKSRPGAAIDPTKGQLIHENPTLIREIEAQLHDQDDDLLQDQEQKRRSPELDNIIQQVFSPQEYQEYTNENSDGNIYLQDQLPTKFPGTDQSSSKASSQRSSPYKVIIIKGGVRPPRRNVLKRKLLLRRLKSPIFRSSQSDSDTNNEQGSEELLHNILESIDREDSDDGNSIRNAFLTKTTTYNISKLVESSKNRSFLIEKLVNYSTNLNLLHSDNVPSNYSDAHSSVLQTVLHLGQHDQNTNISPNNEENWKSDGSDSNDNSLSNDIVASPIRSGVNNEDNNIFKESPEESKSEFLGGQFVRMANESPSKVPKINANKINKQVIPDFVGGTYVGVDDGGESNNLDSNDLKPTPIEFVGGTYVQQQPNSEENVPSRTVKPTIENHELLPPISILGVAPSASQTENYYETTTFSDEGIDRTYKKEFRLEKKYQIPNRKPVFGGNNEVKPAKAKGSVPIVMQLADTPGNILKSKYSGEITTNSDIFTISDDSSIISDNKIKSFGLNKNRNGPSSYTDMPSSFKEEKESILSGVSQKNYNDYGSEEENVETETDSATTESDLSSLENEEYTDRSYAYLGLKPTDSSYGILKTDLTTGNLITERTNDILSKSLTGANSLEEIETESPTRSNIQRYVLPTQPSRGFDLVVGQASDIEPSKLRSQGNTEKPNDLFTSDEQLSEENNITGLVDEVELYAGTGTMESEYQTTPTYILENNNDGSYTFKINNSDSSEENTTELCLPLNKKNYPSLFDLLSGKLYLEKDGRKIKLQLKDNPMKSCNSGTKTCKLFLNLKNSDDPSILDEMFEVSDDNAISKDFDSKSKNGKRHITEENDELDQKSEKDSGERNKELYDVSKQRKEFDGGESVTIQIENKSVSNNSDYNRVEKSNLTETLSSLEKLLVNPEVSVTLKPLSVVMLDDKKDIKYEANILPSQINYREDQVNQKDILNTKDSKSGIESLPMKSRVEKLSAIYNSSHDKFNDSERMSTHSEHFLLEQNIRKTPKNNQTNDISRVHSPVESEFVLLPASNDNSSAEVNVTEKMPIHDGNISPSHFNRQETMNTQIGILGSPEIPNSMPALPERSVFGKFTAPNNDSGVKEHTENNKVGISFPQMNREEDLSIGGYLSTENPINESLVDKSNISEASLNYATLEKKAEKNHNKGYSSKENPSEQSLLEGSKFSELRVHYPNPGTETENNHKEGSVSTESPSKQSLQEESTFMRLPDAFTIQDENNREESVLSTKSPNSQLFLEESKFVEVPDGNTNVKAENIQNNELLSTKSPIMQTMLEKSKFLQQPFIYSYSGDDDNNQRNLYLHSENLNKQPLSGKFKVEELPYNYTNLGDGAHSNYKEEFLSTGSPNEHSLLDKSKFVQIPNSFINLGDKDQNTYDSPVFGVEKNEKNSSDDANLSTLEMDYEKTRNDHKDEQSLPHSKILQTLLKKPIIAPLPVLYNSDYVVNSSESNERNEENNPSQVNNEKITLHSLDFPTPRLVFSRGHRLARKIHQKRDSSGHTGGACGCNNPLLLSPSPVPDYRHFVGKRLAILTNIVHTVKDWVAQDPLRT